MLGKKIRVLNFDGSITKQKQLFEKYDAQVIDFRDLEGRARSWLNSRDRKIIQGRLIGSPNEAITFLGSGDFHQISEILISGFSQQFSLIIFDFHPEWDIWPPRFGCGSWLNQVLKRKNILKVLLIGVSSEDISTFNINSGNLKSLRENRLELYPYAHKPSKVFFKKVPQNLSVEVDRGLFLSTIYWHELAGENLREFFEKILCRLPSRNVYVSIDKDCLNYDAALTNWEEGRFSLEELLLMLKLIKENLEIVGLDITGDYSPIHLNGLIKKIISYWDHPRDIKAVKVSEELISAVNQKTNLEILRTLT